MKLQEIFWLIGIFGMLISNVLVIAALYHSYKFIKSMKKQVKGFFNGTEIKKIVESVFGKGSAAPVKEVFESIDQFHEGYITGLQEYLQRSFEYYMDHLDGNERNATIARSIEFANALEDIKDEGKFLIERGTTIVFAESHKREQQNDARD